MHHHCPQLAGRPIDHVELDPAVVQQEPGTGLGRANQLGERREHEARPARRVAFSDPELVSGLERDRGIAAERTGANLRAAEVLHDGHVLAAGARGGANALK